MIVGVSVCKDSKDKGKTIASIVSTINDKCSKYYQCHHFNNNGSDIVENINGIL